MKHSTTHIIVGLIVIVFGFILGKDIITGIGVGMFYTAAMLTKEI